MSNKAKIAKYRAIISTQTKEIELLQNKLLYADTYEHARLFITDLIKELEEKDEQIKALQDNKEEDNRFISTTDKGLIPVAHIKELLDDSYFFGLQVEQIFELAKKSIRITDDNCSLRHKLEDIAEIMLKLKNFEIECCLEDFIDIYVKKILDIIGEDFNYVLDK